MPSLRRLLIAAVLLATAVSAAAGCGRQPEPTTTTSPAGVDPATAARVTGHVRFDGDPPPVETVRFDADRQCVAAAGGALQPSEALLVGPEGGLAHAFVHISRGLEGRSFPVPADPVVISQQQCRYTPRVVGIRVGQALEIRNGDPLLHNVRSSSAINQPFNQGQPVQGMIFSHTFTTREVMVPLGCDVHGWMQAFIGAIEHPYFTVTDAEGAFSLPDLPPGTYTLEAWHEQLGTRTTEITLGPGGADDVVFTFAR